MSGKLSVSFVLPMFNESENIRGTVGALKMIGGEIADDYEIVVVDDASTDESADIVAKLAEEDDTVKLFRLSVNTKFGGAFAEGFRKAQKDVILYMDSDMPVTIEDIKASFPLIMDADIVTGYSKVKKGDTLKRKIMSGAYNLMVQVLFRLNVRDINSGYKIVRKDAIKGMDFISKSPFVDVELFLHAKRNRRKVKQFPLIFRSRKGGKSHIASVPFILATFRDMLKVRVITLFKRSA